MQHIITERIRQSIRQVPDFPKAGINFYDITTALKDGDLFKAIIEALCERYQHKKFDSVVGMESRGFIFGAPLAVALGTAFVPIRKPGKLPADTESATFLTEYSSESLEIHRDALSDGNKVLVVDDLLATGGTAKGTVDLIHKLGATIVECAFIIELSFLAGREKLKDIPVASLVKYDK